MNVDWRQFHRTESTSPGLVDPQRRLRLCRTTFLLLLTLIFARLLWFHATEADAFRAEALKPLRKQTVLPGDRGRILARDGTVLAFDQETLSIAVQYRWLEDPSDPHWLHSLARSRLPKSERSDPHRVAEEEARVRTDRDRLHRRLAELIGIGSAQWDNRRLEIQTRVEKIAASVERRENPPALLPDNSSTSFSSRIGRALSEAFADNRAPAPGPPIVVAEELEDHIMAQGIAMNVVAEIEAHPDAYPGTRIVHQARRSYPRGSMAVHVIGYLGQPQTPSEIAMSPPGARIGRVGVERQYETQLRGRSGMQVDLTDHGGHLLKSHREEEPGAGRDLILTIDARLQESAEELLESAIARRALQTDGPQSSGGALVVMDVRNGEILAAASMPGFDPEIFSGEDRPRLAKLLADPRHPLFDRTMQMALPPGSVFKAATAIALIEADKLDPQEQFECRGYLKDPDRQRCEIYVRHGVGHGSVDLADALAQSCNVYFFHHAGNLDPAAFLEWTGKFGFARPTGVDLPGEVAGTVPTPETIEKLEGHRWRVSDSQAMAIGQGSLTTTPLQIVRLMAAIANGGKLVTPHVARDVGPGAASPGAADMDDSIRLAPPQPIAGLQVSTLDAVRRGLERVVNDPKGTAYGSVRIPSITIAGKTGTATIGEGLPEHAWFAGYVPADAPHYALVVVLERAGDATATAGPVAKRLVMRMDELGMLGNGAAD